MYLINDLSKGKRELYRYLGKKPYEIMGVDFEVCVYLTIGDYAIEISGGKRMKDYFCIYVWHTKGRRQIVETYPNIEPDFEKIKKLLNTIRLRYGDKEFIRYKGNVIDIEKFIQAYAKHVDPEEARDLRVWCEHYNIKEYIPNNFIVNQEKDVEGDKCIHRVFMPIRPVSDFVFVHTFIFKNHEGKHYYTAQPYVNEALQLKVVLKENDREGLIKVAGEKGLDLWFDEEGWIEKEDRELIVITHKE